MSKSHTGNAHRVQEKELCSETTRQQVKTYTVPPVTIVVCLLSLATLGKIMGESSDMACDAFLCLT